MPPSSEAPATSPQDETSHFHLSTDMCLRLVEAGLTLRDLQSCTRVSKSWRETWHLTMRESPSFFIKSFFRDSGPHAEATDREGRYREFKDRMRERLNCILEGAHTTLVPMRLPEIPPSEQLPLQKFEFQKTPLASTTSLVKKAFEETSVRCSFLYHDGLVAWNMDGDHFVVDDLREGSWKRFSIVKPAGEVWDYGRPQIQCMNKNMVVFRTQRLQVIVYNLHTGAVITLLCDEPLTMFGSAAKIHAVGNNLVFFCPESKHIVEYSIDWDAGPETGQQQVQKVKEMQLPHPNFTSIFFDGDSTDTIFGVTYGRKKVIIYEFLHSSLKKKHLVWALLKDVSWEGDFQLYPCCRGTDSRGNIELGYTIEHTSPTLHRASSSLIFNTATRRFLWRHHPFAGQDGLRWINWQYTPEVLWDSPGFGLTVVAEQCTPLSEDAALPLQDRKGWGLERVRFEVPEEAAELVKGDYWRTEVFVDDEFLVFVVDVRAGGYWVFDIKAKKGGGGSQGITVFSRERC